MNKPKFLKPTEVDEKYGNYNGTCTIGLEHLKIIFPGYRDAGLTEEIEQLRGPDRKNYYGMMDPEETNILVGIIIAMQPSTIFEIGTSYGMLTKYMADAAPKAKIHTLDIGPSKYDEARFKVDGWNRKYISDKDEDVGIAIREAGLEERVTQHIGDSGTFDFSPFYKKMDIVVVDANHSYKSTKHDLNKAFKMASPNGLIVNDDYGKLDHSEGVTLAVLEQTFKHGRTFYHINDKSGPHTGLVFHLNMPESKLKKK